jgi:RNA polymerase sigma factor (sigma-70 family)
MQALLERQYGAGHMVSTGTILSETADTGLEPSRTISDRELLERFVRFRDETAFATLVQRYARAIVAVCRRVLHQEQDIEDVCQAVLLVLARRAAAIRKGEAVGSWLYGVAYRTAMNARHHALRRQEKESQAIRVASEPSALNEAAARELQCLLDQAVQGLAEKFRAPFVLCCLEGLSKSEAARELGWREGTVSGRLAQARKLLQKRLARRGITLSAALTAIALSQSSAAAATPALVTPTIIQAALAPSVGQTVSALSPAAISLGEGLLRAMVTVKIKAAMALVLGLALASLGGTLLALPWTPVGQPEIVLAQAPPPGARDITIDEQVLAVAFSPDGTRLATAGARWVKPGQLKVWEVSSGKLLYKLRGIAGIRSVAFSPDGQQIVAGQFGGMLRLHNAANGGVQRAVQAHEMGVNGLAYSADGKRIATAGLDRLVKVWDVPDLDRPQVFAGHTDMVYSVAYFRHGRAIVSAGMDRTARIWDLSTGKEKFLLRGHGGAIDMVAVSPDDQLVGTASWDRTVKLWDAETGKELATLRGHDHNLQALAFSPDRRLLVAAAYSGTLYFWDVPTRKLLDRVQKHFAPVWSVAFSPDGARLASGSTDRTAILWDAASRKDTATLNTSEIFSVGAPPLMIEQMKPETARDGTTPASDAAKEGENSGGRGSLLMLGLIASLVAILAFGLGLYWRRQARGAGNAPDSASAISEVQELPISFACEKCGKALKAKAHLAGKQGTCPQCKHPITIPETSPPASDPPATSAARPPSSSRKLPLISLLVVGTLLLGAGLLVALHRPRRPSQVDVVVGCEFKEGVEESGFRAQQYDVNQRPYRWTDGHATLRIPISQDRLPHNLHMHLWPWRPPNTELAEIRIVVNQRELFKGTVAPDHWEQVLDLTGMELGGEVTVEIVSNTFQPSALKNAGPDNRTLGVQVRGVTLLSAEGR